MNVHYQEYTFVAHFAPHFELAALGNMELAAPRFGSAVLAEVVPAAPCLGKAVDLLCCSEVMLRLLLPWDLLAGHSEVVVVAVAVEAEVVLAGSH